MTFDNWKETLTKELDAGLSGVEDEKITSLVQDILSSRAIYCDGKGRSGLMISSFAMRLSQMNLISYVPWGATTPALTKNDLLLISSGSGETENLVEHAKKARSVGAKIVLITTNTESTLGKLADYSIRINGGTKQAISTATIQPMGSLFEQCVLLLLDGIVMRLMEAGRITEESMRERHSNLE